MDSTNVRTRELVWQTRGFPIVLDSSRLLPELCESGRQGTPTRELRLLQDNPFIFTSGAVYDEVEGRLPAMAVERGVDPESAIQVWRVILETTRVVDVADLQPTGDISIEVEKRDATDVPTAILASLISPCVVLAADKDLVAPGLATSTWAPVYAFADLTASVGALQGQGVATYAVASLPIGVGRAFVRVARRQPPILVLSLILGSISVGLAIRRIRQSQRSAEMLAMVGQSVWTWLEMFADNERSAASAAERLTTHVVSSNEMTLLSCVASELATSSEPRSAGELAERLRNIGVASGARLLEDIRNILREGRAFVEVHRGRWQLGEVRSPGSLKVLIDQ